MRKFTVIMIAFCCSNLGIAQHNHFESIKKIMQQDSLEYAWQLQDADRIKHQTDSMLRKELGHTGTILPVDSSTTTIQALRQMAATELERRQAAEQKKYYLFTGAIFFLIIAVIMAFKRKQFARDTDKSTG